MDYALRRPLGERGDGNVRLCTGTLDGRGSIKEICSEDDFLRMFLFH